jgi:hypothetical protein
LIVNDQRKHSRLIVEHSQERRKVTAPSNLNIVYFFVQCAAAALNRM